jgi:predicted TIM-barrel fold metal-dependent hydrolase
MACGSAGSRCSSYDPVRRVAGALLALLGLWGCCDRAASADSVTGVRYYSLADFQRVEKIDAHVHVHGEADRFMAQAIHDNFRILTINVDDPDFPPIPEQERAAVSLRHRYPGRVAFAATFSVQNFGAPDWTDDALQQVEHALKEGAVGVKIWKNIGMGLIDADGRYVMPDDHRLEPLIARLERDRIVLLGHQAEPLNCWLSFDKMTVRSDRDYFREHPQYYMYAHPEMPAHDTILAARDRMLNAHSALRFDALHLASLEWDVDKVANFLDRFPNANVDLAARLVHLEFQAASNPRKVRQFLMRYQDRILYGSDDSYGPGDFDARAVAEVHSGWIEDWRFLASSDRLHSSDFAKSFQGLHLPRGVIDKIYRRNAQSLFAGAWISAP